MKKYKITWSPKARKDLQDIHFYIEYYLKEKNIANKIIKKILNLISTLSYSPEKYVRIQNFADETRNIRRMPVDNYVVIYEVDNNTRTSLYITYFSWQSKLSKHIIVLFFQNI